MILRQLGEFKPKISLRKLPFFETVNSTLMFSSLQIKGEEYNDFFCSSDFPGLKSKDLLRG